MCSILAKREALPKSLVYTGWYHFESDRIVQIEVVGKRLSVNRLPLKLQFSNWSESVVLLEDCK